MKLSKIKPNPKNPRKISPEALDRLKRSIERDPGFMRLRPIVVDGDGMILGGNQRYAAIKALGMKEIPAEWVKTAADFTEDQKKRFLIVDNSTPGMSGQWDSEMLETWDADELEDLGLSADMESPPAPVKSLAEIIAAEAEYVEQYDAASRRAETIKKRIDKISTKNPELLAKARAVVLSSGTNEAIIIADEALGDFLTEIRRRVESGEGSPLADILNATHRL
jgi:hypothetical protein